MVLQEISAITQKTIRKSDYFARYGGEEFVIVLPRTELSNAIDLAERLRIRIEKRCINVGCRLINTTASFGVATTGNEVSKELLIKHADEMLYGAKLNGRNRVMPELYPKSSNVISFYENIQK